MCIYHRNLIIVPCFSASSCYRQTVFLKKWSTAQPSYEVTTAVWRGTHNIYNFGHHNKMRARSVEHDSTGRSLVWEFYSMRFLWVYFWMSTFLALCTPPPFLDDMQRSSYPFYESIWLSMFCGSYTPLPLAWERSSYPYYESILLTVIPLLDDIQRSS
jgi:hypothetical protein